MKAASCFSGIGAPEMGGPQFNWLWHAEIEKFPAAVMDVRFPHSVNLGDVTAEDFMQRASSFGPLDLLVGGPPCQAFSVAGLRRSMQDDRGNLSLRFVRIAHAIRPRNLLVENVPGWLNTPDNAFGCFLGAILGADDALLPCERPAVGKSNAGWKWRHAKRAFMLRERGEDGLPVYIERDELDEYEPHEWQTVELDARHIPVWPGVGMASGPLGRLCWATLDAQWFGVAQRRRRVFVVVDFGDGADPCSVLFEPEGVRRHSPPRREAGQGTAVDAGERASCGGCDTGYRETGQGWWTEGVAGLRADPGGMPENVVVSAGFGGGNTSGPIDVATAQTAHGQRLDFDTETFVTHSLRGEGFDASEDGTGRGTPIVPVAFSSKDYGNDATDDLSPTLRSMGHADSHANGGGQVAIAFAHQGGGDQTTLGFDPEARTSMTLGANQTPAIAFVQNQRDEVRTMDIAGALAAEPGMKQQTYVATEPVAWSIMPQNSGKDFKAREVEVSQPIMAGGPVGGNQGGDYIQQEWQVRRLTPTECERLQGFPDGFTDITYRGKPAADGPRYKALGNSWAVPCGAWIIGRIASLLQNEGLPR